MVEGISIFFTTPHIAQSPDRQDRGQARRADKFIKASDSLKINYSNKTDLSNTLSCMGDWLLKLSKIKPE